MIDLKKYDIIQIYLLFFNNIFQHHFNLDLCLGVFYMYCHQLYCFLMLFILFFTTNVYYLFIIIIIVIINLGSIFILKTCPLYLMEKKYINTCFFDSCMKLFKTDCNLNNKKINKKYLTKYCNFTIDEPTCQIIGTVLILFLIKLMILIIL